MSEMLKRQYNKYEVFDAHEREVLNITRQIHGKAHYGCFLWTLKGDTCRGGVRFHHTDIIEWDGRLIKYTNGGWETPTTKKKLELYLPPIIRTIKGSWYVGFTQGTISYQIPWSLVDNVWLDESLSIRGTYTIEYLLDHHPEYSPLSREEYALRKALGQI